MDSELINDFLLEAFPNPERKGCPDEGTLKALAEGRLPLNDPAGLHVGSCSECYAEYRHYRIDWQEIQQAQTSGSDPDAQSGRVGSAVLKPAELPSPVQSRFLPLAVAASLIVLLSGGIVAYRYEHARPIVGVQVASTVPVNASVDLFDAATLRGGGGEDPEPLQQVSLPAAIVHLGVTLPRFSQSGSYQVKVSKDKAGSQVVATGAGLGVDSNGKVGVNVTLDLRAAKSGAYFLSTVRGADNGTYYYPLEVK